MALPRSSHDKVTRHGSADGIVGEEEPPKEHAENNKENGNRAKRPRRSGVGSSSDALTRLVLMRSVVRDEANKEALARLDDQSNEKRSDACIFFETDGYGCGNTNGSANPSLRTIEQRRCKKSKARQVDKTAHSPAAHATHSSVSVPVQSIQRIDAPSSLRRRASARARRESMCVQPVRLSDFDDIIGLDTFSADRNEREATNRLNSSAKKCRCCLCECVCVCVCGRERERERECVHRNRVSLQYQHSRLIREFIRKQTDIANAWIVLPYLLK